MSWRRLLPGSSRMSALLRQFSVGEGMRKNRDVPVCAERIIGLADYIRLVNLLLGPGTAMPAGVRLSFLKVLELAEVVAPEHLPSHIARIGSVLTVRDCATGEERRGVLNWPTPAADSGSISVVTPLGSVLIGVTENAIVAHDTPGGAVKTYEVLSVSNTGG